MARSSDAAFPMSLIRDKAFQLRQVKRVFFLTIIFIVQSTLMLGVFYHHLLGDLVAGNAPLLFASEDMGAMAETVPSLASVLGQWLLVMLFVNAAITTAIAVFILRRLGNPILALRRVLNEIGDGNISTRLRVGDASEFEELYVALNRAMSQINEKIKKAHELTSIVEQLDDQPAADDESVRNAMIECREVLNYFNIDDLNVNPDDSQQSASR